jgi:hypothetical protein
VEEKLLFILESMNQYLWVLTSQPKLNYKLPRASSTDELELRACHPV